MKKVSIFLVSCLMALSIGAQNNAGIVTIKIDGNRNKEVLVDGKSYAVSVNTDINSNTTTAVNMPITINDLQTGQHTLQVVRSNTNNNNTSATNTVTFNLRSGYDLQITISKNGSVQQNETRKTRNWNSGTQYKTPMSTTNFNVLLQGVQNEWRASARKTLVTNAFANTGNYFTTAQARQLLQLVNSQSSRLKLAKSAYRSITDPANFSQLYDLLNSQASRNELASYVTVYNANNPSNNTSYKTPMTDASFTALYQDIDNQWQAGAKMSAIANVFTNTNNYYTTYQARQLIELIPEESNMLSLAKLSYRGITDPTNFSQLYDLFNSPASRNELAAYVNSSNNSNPYKTAMPDASFKILYQDIQNQWQPGAKVSAITNAFTNTNNYFSTYQARQLIQLIDAESSRLQLAKQAYRSIVDPANFTQLYDLLSNQASKNELAAFVISYNNGSPVYTSQIKTPMTDASFNALYRDVQFRFGLGAKMSALTDIFATTTNYFTTSQAKQLIELVSLESNRLQLAKSSYDNIVDPANFTQLYDLLSSQASRNELAEYVRSYSDNR